MNYAQYSPTSFDVKGLGLPDQQNWLVVPVQQNRDSDVLSRSNFAIALRELGGESDQVEVHSFGHWACGWFELIIVHPNLASQVEAIEASLENYPILDEMHYGELEYETACETWERMSLADRVAACQRYDVSVFAARRDEIPSDTRGELIGYLAE